MPIRHDPERGYIFVGKPYQSEDPKKRRKIEETLAVEELNRSDRPTEVPPKKKRGSQVAEVFEEPETKASSIDQEE